MNAALLKNVAARLLFVSLVALDFCWIVKYVFLLSGAGSSNNDQLRTLVDGFVCRVSCF